jgi:hypothetical protein
VYDRIKNAHIKFLLLHPGIKKIHEADCFLSNSVSKETSIARKHAAHMKILAVKCLKVAVVFGKWATIFF